MANDDASEAERMLHRFHRLLGELMRGQVSRTSFLSWELEIILDFHQCELPAKRRTEILRQYQRAVRRQLQGGAGPPMKLSEFLAARERRRKGVKPSEPGGPRSDSGPPGPSG